MILRRPADGYTILQCAAASGVWKPWFRDPQTWTPWRTFLSVLFGLSLDDEEHALYRQCTGRSTMPRDGFTEAWLICGRKAGKSFNLALIACYLAVFRDWSSYLTPGEIGTIKIIANDRRQARVIHRYCRALLTQPPALAARVEREIVAVDCRVVRQDATANVDRYMRGDDCADAAASKAPLEVDPRPGSGTVIVIDTSRDAGSEQSVSYLQIAKFNRFEKDVPVHRYPCR